MFTHTKIQALTVKDVLILDLKKTEPKEESQRIIEVDKEKVNLEGEKEVYVYHCILHLIFTTGIIYCSRQLKIMKVFLWKILAKQCCEEWVGKMERELEKISSKIICFSSN